MRDPWSVPKRHELAYVLIGIIIGAFLTWLVTISGRDGAWILWFMLLAVLPGALVFINAIGWLHASDEKGRALQREADDLRFWTTVVNRSATNKRPGLRRTGRHAQRK